MATFGIFDEDNLKLEHPNDFLLLTNGTDALNIFPAQAQRNQRQFPDDGLRYFPIPIDLQRKWPDI